MTTHITFEQALAGLEKAVRLKGRSYKYEPPVVDDADGLTMCMYFETDSGQPSCIVGHVLADHGVTLESLGPANADETVGSLVASDVLALDARTEALLVRAQQEQDNGTSWGEALRQAKATVNAC